MTGLLTRARSDRRIRCDLGLPTCANCARSNQECQGYGLRLSWPRPGDKRRTILVDTPSKNTLTADPLQHNRGDWPFVNMHSWHISSWFNLVEGRMEGKKTSIILFNVFFSLCLLSVQSPNDSLIAPYQRVNESPSPRTTSLSLIEENESTLLHYCMWLGFLCNRGINKL